MIYTDESYFNILKQEIAELRRENNALREQLRIIYEKSEARAQSWEPSKEH